MNFRVKKDIKVTMRDGVALSTDVWLPDGGPSPVLLVRTPYGKELLSGGAYAFPLHPDMFSLLEAGYAVIWQDCRGTSMSDGVFEPMVNDPMDGVDTIEWIAAQPWCDGNVGTYGASYMGFTQFSSASQGPRELKAIAPASTSADYYVAPWYSRGGAMSWRNVHLWSIRMCFLDALRAERRGESDGATLPSLDAVMSDPRAFDSTAVEQPLLTEGARWWSTWLNNSERSEFWAELSILDRAESISVPALHVVGWFDYMVDAAIDAFKQLRARGGSADARCGQRLIVGPWDHNMSPAGYADRVFPLTAGPMAINLTQRYVDFYDQWLRGVSPSTDAAPVHIFVMGIDEWRDEQDWPLPDTTYVDYFLTSGGGANTAAGDGELTCQVASNESYDAFTYDPANPVPTLGGRTDLPGTRISAGPTDERAVEDRPDVLCFTTNALEEALEVTGHISLVVFMKSTAVDTDITGKLVDVYPDGRAIYLSDGILRTRYRDSLEIPKLLDPGCIYELVIDLSVTSNVFLPGHKLRLEVSSSNFPRYDRNTNTGGEIARETIEDSRSAINTVLHGPSYPSRLVLPVISR